MLVKALDAKLFSRFCILFDQLFESGMLFKLTGKTTYYGNPFSYNEQKQEVSFRCFDQLTEESETIADTILDFVSSCDERSCNLGNFLAAHPILH